MTTPPGSAERGTVHLITVGVSLFDKLQADRMDLEKTIDDDALGDRIDMARAEFHDPDRDTKDRAKDAKQTSTWLTLVTTPDSGEDRKKLEDLLSRVEPRRWPARASAELSSLAAKNPPSNSTRLPETDTALLLSSDTRQGLRAALFNAVALAGGDLDRVCYLPKPVPEVYEKRGKVVVVRVPGLDVGKPEEFVEAMRSLGALGQGVDRMLEEAGDKSYFHLSGGFKAAMPFLLGLGEALLSLRGKSKVQAFALHELSPGLLSIEMPLRSFPLEFLREQLSQVNEEGTLPPVPLDNAPLLGFAYEASEDGLTWKLTPFGAALDELIPAKSST